MLYVTCYIIFFMATALYRKYRPLTFSDVIGQGHIVQTLSNAILHNRIGHAYLFTGPRGTGKTTMARIFARAVNCSNPKGADPCLECDICKNITQGTSLDIFEIDAASNTGVDNIRELRENVKFPSSQAKFKVYIIDEVHMLSTGAFNALLKTLEEPPAHVIFILATTEIHKVPETIISRCQRYDFTRLSLEHIIEKLSTIAKNEKISVEKNALEMIAIAAEGGMRDAESLLSQVMALEDKKITAKEVEEILGTTQRQSLEAMVSYLLGKNAASAITLVNELSKDGYDLDVFNKSFLNYLRQVMLVCVDEKLAKIFSYELTKEQSLALVDQAKNHSPKELLYIIACFTEIQGKIKSAFIPQLPLEMAIIKSTQNGTELKTEEHGKIQIPAQTAPTASQMRAPEPTRVVQAPTAPQTPKIPPVLPVTPKSAETAPSIAVQETKIEVPDPEALSEPKLIKNEAQIADSDFTINDVKKNWGRFIIDTKAKNHSLSAVLQSCQPVSVEAGIVTVATKFTFHKDKLNEYGNKLTLEETFAKILGLRLLIKVITAEEAGITIASSLNQNTNPAPTEQTPHETSSLLNDAMNLMGGNIVQ
ncbi:MAG TPA: DNA polymerase III subunit gamma/tau [Candidatus Moranbacteria bacterium]|nr:DNA polymerase III subunit gamma/tau [Candidatus Moranbacteria bacterium]HBT46175.1 DNA polymerase III subunit gamma/tau [Candidatus Moranbacteria bacterium]